MIIKGRNYKISVLVLLMELELEVTVKTIEMLASWLEDDVSISVLLNGGFSPALRTLCNGCDRLFYYESATNLGVAGGRNYLFGREECRHSDIVMILDNDVIVPRDYVRELAGFLVEHEEAGVVGGVAADLKVFNPTELHDYETEGRFGGIVWQIRCSEIRELVCRKPDSRSIYHMGMIRDYGYAYFALKPHILTALNILTHGRLAQRFVRPQVKHDPEILAAVAAGVENFVVSTVAGCSQAFRRRVLDEVGPLNECFNPYGYEDSDFCLRVVQAGYVNYVTNGAWLFHGTDNRHSGRDQAVFYRMIFRGITILSSLHLTRIEFAIFLLVKLPVWTLCILAANRSVGKIVLLKSICSGIVAGLHILICNAGILRPNRA